MHNLHGILQKDCTKQYLLLPFSGPFCMRMEALCWIAGIYMLRDVLVVQAVFERVSRFWACMWWWGIWTLVFCAMKQPFLPVGMLLTGLGQATAGSNSASLGLRGP